MMHITIAGRRIGPGEPPYVIAELSGNHGQQLDRARRLVEAAAVSGADAVKLQTYTADTMTIESDQPWFQIGEGTIWSGRTLHDLYREAFTPWEWHEELRDLANGLGLTLFSSPFDESAVDFLESLDMPAYKIASFEIVDIELIQRVAATGKPLVISTGMATDDEIDAAMNAARAAGATDIALLRCNSSYPAVPGDLDLLAIPAMQDRWHVPVGVSDHTLGVAVSVAAVALGACIIEKHIALSRQETGPDVSFSLEPAELTDLVRSARDAHDALGEVRYGPTERERASLVFRRSLFVVEDVAAGATLDRTNVRAIRPGHGLPPVELPRILGRRASVAIARGTPLTWDLIS